jgi:hypothetical protein
VYVANDNFVVQIDICKKIKKLVHATIIWL